MLTYLDSILSLETVIWLLPVTFMLHDFEEIIFVEAWFRRKYERAAPLVPARFRRTFDEMSRTTAAQFSIPVLMQFILYALACWLAVDHEWYGLFVGFNALLLLHVFMHVGQSVVLRTYALGVGTALCITLPYSLYVFYRLLDEGAIRYGDIAASLPYGLITVAVVLLGHKLAAKVV
ncbi:HXXEE domain-containing protein [Paenibacillus chartarius]|uniref:HXXEE domain-containing protein n=1 Tax=Paenibacillus chartarius TaxID=747481 RepID=A0ABV6DHU8_9BACL